MEDISACVAQFQRVIAAENVGPGGIQHAVEQLRVAGLASLAKLEVELEAPFTVQMKSGQEITRNVDVLITDLKAKTASLVEVKSSASLAEALSGQQLVADAMIAATENAIAGVKEINNIWKFTNVEFSESSETLLRERLEAVQKALVKQGLDKDQIKQALESFNFVDAVGVSMKAVLDKNGEIIFEPAMDALLGPDGTLAKVAEKHAKGSPDFNPAMEAVLGSDGKLAQAATGAAQGANLEPAMQGLEEKIEEGLGNALEEAGQKAASQSAAQLGQKVGEGVTALGNAMQAVPQLYNQVEQLGAAWDKPNKSTKDYMALMSVAGGTLNQGVQVITALAGVTKLAAAAQAVFNAVANANPIGLVVLAVVALIAVVTALIVYWDEIKAAIRDNPWIGVIAAMTGVIGIIVLIIAYWDEIKLAVLDAANYISIQAQRIGAFFVGLRNLVGQVWDWIIASAYNAGVSIINTYITVGTEVQNFFIQLVNSILGMYNELATSAAGEFAGLEPAELIPEADIQARIVPMVEVPQVSAEAAFAHGPITGGLESAIEEQERVLAAAVAEDEERRRAKAQEEAAAAAAAPAAPAPAAGLGLGAPPALPSASGVMMPSAAGGAGVHVEGGITVNISAERLEANAAQMLSDEIVRRLKERLDALRVEQDFRTGNRGMAPA